MAACILCVEDNPQNMRLVRKILVHAGYTVYEAIDGESAIELTQSAAPDLILMDINLPDIDGVEVTRRIQIQDDLAAIPIIALTAVTHYGKEDFLNLGFIAYISKPVRRVVLLELIRDILNE